MNIEFAEFKHVDVLIKSKEGESSKSPQRSGGSKRKRALQFLKAEPDGGMLTIVPESIEEC